VTTPGNPVFEVTGVVIYTGGSTVNKYVVVTLNQQVPEATERTAGNNTLTMTLLPEEASKYVVGSKYELTLSPQ